MLPYSGDWETTGARTRDVSGAVLERSRKAPAGHMTESRNERGNRSTTDLAPRGRIPGNHRRWGGWLRRFPHGRSNVRGAAALALILLASFLLSGAPTEKPPSVDIVQPVEDGPDYGGLSPLSAPSTDESAAPLPSVSPTPQTSSPGEDDAFDEPPADEENPVDESTPVDDTPPPPPDGERNVQRQSPAMTPDGRFVAFDRYWYQEGHHRAIVVYDRQTEVMSGAGDGNGPLDISADGRYVAYQCCNVWVEVRVRDMLHGTTTVLGGSSDADPQYSGDVSMSDDGRLIAFRSTVDKLVPGDTNNESDVFIHDMTTGVTKLVSVSSTGKQANGPSVEPQIANDGKTIVFSSSATNLTDGPFPTCDYGNACRQVYLHDLSSGVTSLITPSSNGGPVEGGAADPTISDDGRYVAFESPASWPTTEEDPPSDIFRHDRETDETMEVSASHPSGSWTDPTISGDGNLIGYYNEACCDVAYGLWLYDVDADTQRSIDATALSGLDFSADGTILTYSNGDGFTYGDVVILNLVSGATEKAP